MDLSSLLPAAGVALTPILGPAAVPATGLISNLLNQQQAQQAQKKADKNALMAVAIQAMAPKPQPAAAVPSVSVSPGSMPVVSVPQMGAAASPGGGLSMLKNPIVIAGIVAVLGLVVFIFVMKSKKKGR